MSIAFPGQAQVQLTLGLNATGKTGLLVDTVRQLLAAGAKPDEILVFAASPDAARELQLRLAAAVADGEVPQVLTVREQALRILGCDEARAATGREPRLLARFETSFAMEDMKVSGLRPKKIGELVNFFSRSWTELANFEDGWLLYREEEETYARLQAILDGYQAYLEPGVASAAVGFLRDDPGQVRSFGATYVFADDYQCYSRASQYLVNALALRQLFVYANPDDVVTTFDSYPYAPGVAELLRERPETQVQTLTASQLPKTSFYAIKALQDLVCAAPADSALEGDKATDVADAVVSGKSADESGTRKAKDAKDAEAGEAAIPDLWSATAAQGEGTFDIVPCETPADECAQICAWVRKLAGEGLEPRDIAITVPNKTWERNLASSLLETGFPVCRGSEGADIGGDIRYADLSLPAQVCTLLTLAADSRDVPALRAWYGFGDYLTHRQLFSEVFELSHRLGTPVPSLLDEFFLQAEQGTLDRNDLLTYKHEVERLLPRYQELQRDLAALRDFRGKALVEGAVELVYGTRTLPGSLAPLFDGVQEDDSAQAVVSKMWRAMLFPQLREAGAIALVAPARMVGLPRKAVAASGMVSGFTPKHRYFDRTKTSPQQAARMLARDAATFSAVIGQAHDHCALFSFKTLRGTDAEMHDLRVDRFYAEDGRRMAQVHQSLLLDQIEGIGIKEQY